MAPVDYNQFNRTYTDKDGKKQHVIPAVGSGAKHVNLWWKVEGDELANAIAYNLEFLKNHQVQRVTQWIVSSRLYGNQALVGRAGITFSRVASTQPWLKERISWNCVQAAGDTVTSKMAKNKPKPLFLSSGGDYKIQRRCKLLNKFVDGVFYENEAYKLGVQAFLDGVVWGDGVLKVFPGVDANNQPRVKYERVISSELWVDELDGFYGCPQSMYHAKDIDKQVLCEMVKKWFEKDGKSDKDYAIAEEAILRAPRSNPSNADDYIADKCEVVESWHLPSGPDADDGKHTITIMGKCLMEEKWEHDCFPFAFFTWTKRLYGFWGQGLAEQLQNIQLEINSLLQTIKQSFWKGGTFRVFLPTGSRVVKEHISNQIGTIVSYTGQTPPTIVTPSLVQPEIFQHLQSLWQKAFEQAGVSMLQAAAIKPQGLNSGVAMREYNDIQSDRFMTIGQAYERLFMDLAKISIMVVKDITKSGKKSYKVKVPERGKFIKEVDWKDVNLTADQYIMKVFPISSLPTEPAGRLEQITEWVQAGWINPRQGKKLMDFPDLEQVEGLSNAAEDWLTQILDSIVDDGIYVSPEPLDDLQLARELSLEYYQRGKCQGLEEERLQLLRDFITQIQFYEDQAAAKLAASQSQPAAGGQQPGTSPPQPGAQQPQQGGPPGANPTPTPVSQLLPNGPKNGASA